MRLQNHIAELSMRVRLARGICRPTAAVEVLIEVLSVRQFLGPTNLRKLGHPKPRSSTLRGLMEAHNVGQSALYRREANTNIGDLEVLVQRYLYEQRIH